MLQVYERDHVSFGSAVACHALYISEHKVVGHVQFGRAIGMLAENVSSSVEATLLVHTVVYSKVVYGVWVRFCPIGTRGCPSQRVERPVIVRLMLVPV